MAKAYRPLRKAKNYGRKDRKRHEVEPEPVNRATRRAAKAMEKKSKK